MKRILATAIVTASAFVGAYRLTAQAPAAATSDKPTPRTADGHPDLSGVWWGGADVGGKGFKAGGKGGETFTSLYNAAAQAKAKTLSDKDDPALRCRNTAFGTLNVSMYAVGAVAQIVQTPKFAIFLTETYNSFQIVPFDGRPHRDNAPPSTRGDAVGHWDGDTLVIDKNNFTDEGWIWAEGRVSFHSDALHMVERYRRPDFNHLEIDATLDDPKVLTKPWVVPTQKLVLAPFDQLLELSCSGDETEALIEAAQGGKKK